MIMFKSLSKNVYSFNDLLEIDIELGISTWLCNSASLIDADCLVLGESQDSSQCSVKKYPVKPSALEGDSLLMQEQFDSFNQYFTAVTSVI